MTVADTENLAQRAVNAAKWSSITQVVSKLISPITTMVLARLLTPNDFGIVASAAMIVSLADLISDAGFQQYLIQHDFKDDKELHLNASVSFWTNLTVSLLLVICVVVFGDQIASLVGCPGEGLALAIASLSIPLTSLVSVQTGLFQRNLDFKTLFGSRFAASLTVFLVSIVLALLGLRYWAMIAGTIASNVVLAVWLTAKSRWKPRFEYSFVVLREVLSYGLWILGESIATWINTWAGTFIIGALMDPSSVGLYKTSTSIAGSIVAVFTGAILPVAFSTLSKVQNDDARFERVFFKMQKYLAVCIAPIAIGAFVYHDELTFILLGDQWLETSFFLGSWLLSGSIVVVFGYMCSEAYRAKGVPRYCVVVQVLYLIPFLPALYISALHGYECVSMVMPITRLALVVINVTVAWAALKLSPIKMGISCRWPFCIALVSMLPSLLKLVYPGSVIASCFAICASVAIYVVLLFAVPDMRHSIFELVERLKKGKDDKSRI